MSMQSFLKKAQKKQMEEQTKLDPVDPENPDAAPGAPLPVKKNPNQMAKSLGGIQKGGGQQQKSTRKKI